MASITHADIYAEVRAYMLGLFSCAPETIIPGPQVGMTLPDDAIVMSVLSEHALDVATNYYQPVENKVYIQQSVQMSIQIEFYGEGAMDKALKLCNLWKNHYTVDHLHCCQPLYCEDPQQKSSANEKSLLPQPWLVVLTLQYNPEFELDQIYLDKPEIILTKP